MTLTAAALAALKLTVYVIVPAASFTSTGPLKLMLGIAPSVMVPVPVTGVAFCAVAADTVILSVPSATPSAIVATRSKKLCAPAGTLTAPAKFNHVAPPSTEYCCAPVSTPTVALPEIAFTFTAVAVVLVPVKLIVKTKALPSATVALPIEATTGRSSFVPSMPVPSSLIVTMLAPEPIVTLVGFVKFTVNVSPPSYTRSLVIGTVMVLLVSPGANTTLPITGVKSEPEVALPLVVL